MKVRWLGLVLEVVRDLREQRAPASPEEVADFETDVLAGFVLARASAGLADATIRGDVGHLEQVRVWFGKSLWDMEAADADIYFGKVLRDAAKGTRLARTQALTTYFQFLELRHKVEIHQLTGRVVECPIDEMNRPRGARTPRCVSHPAKPASVRKRWATSTREGQPTDSCVHRANSQRLSRSASRPVRCFGTAPARRS